jgi:hypothetical protein
MKINFKNALLVLAIVFVTAECKKKADEPEPEPTPTPTTPSGPNNLTDLFAANGNTVTTSSGLNSTAAQTLAVSGVQIVIPANSFVTASGGTVTGNIDIATKSVFTKSDIILSGAPANAQGKLVATKGCIKTSASQNGQVLRLAPTTTVHVLIPEPGTAVTTLRKYYANKVSVSDSTQCWKAAPDSSNIPLWVDSMTFNKYYKVKIDSVNWLNAGYVYNPAGTKTSVTVNAGNTMFNKSNLAVYISINGESVVGALYEVSGGTYKIQNIPVGAIVRIIGIAAVNGTYYSSFSNDITVTAGQMHNLNLQSTTNTAIKSALNALP